MADPLIDYLEETFATAYRKEIDQEENIWRSLPFFAATIALQVAAIGLVRDWIAAASGPMFWFAVIVLFLAGASTFGAVILLTLSVWPSEPASVWSETKLLDYATELRNSAGTPGESASLEALLLLKTDLIEQYAAAATSNRALNTRRARARTRAGLAVLGSVTLVLALVAVLLLTYVMRHG